MIRNPGGRNVGAGTTLIGLVPLVCCIFAAIWASRGFDISDDSFYIISALDAGLYRESLIEFGYFWRTVFRLLGGDLYLFRLSGTVFLLVAAAWFAAGMGARFFSQERQLQHYGTAAIVTSAFWQYGSWLPTPSYNLLNLGGLLLFFGGLLLAPGRDQPDRGRAWLAFVALVAGAGLCLTMLAKPTTTVAAVLLGLSWVGIAPPRRLMAALLLTALTGLVGYALVNFLIDGSPAAFLARKAFSLHAMTVLDRGNSFAGLEHTLLGPLRERGIPKVIAVAGAAALYLTVLGVWWRAAWRGRDWLAGLLAVVLAVLLAVMRARDFMRPLSVAFHFWHLAFFVVMLAIIVAAVRAHRGTRGMLLGRAAVLGAIPLAYSVGTNTTIVLHISGAAIFWCAATLAVLASGQEGRRLVPQAAFLFAVLTLGLLVGITVTPLSNAAPLWRQDIPMAMRDDLRVNVDRSTRDYIGAFQTAARANGLRQGMPVLDLTGQGPGMTLALGGVAPGVPWLHHGGANVMDYTALMLHQAPQSQLRTAWVITDSGAGTTSESAVLRGVGLDFPHGYRLVASRSWPAAGMAHVLWKPKEP